MATEAEPAQRHPEEPGGDQAGDHDRQNSDDDHDGEDGGEDQRAASQEWHVVAPAVVRHGQVGDQGVELSVGAGGKGDLEAVLELFGEQSALGRGVTQAISDPISVGIGRSQG